MREEAVLLGKTTRLVGIITSPGKPEGGSELPAILFLNCGVFHRVGPNRLYVKMARAFASLGFVSLRFDLSGIGDSPVRQDNLPRAKSTIVEVQEAMDYLASEKGLRHFVLAGICSGARLACLSALSDRRVAGAVLINDAGHRRGDFREYHRTLIRHYLRIVLFSSFRGKTWPRVFKLQFGVRPAIRAVFSTLRNPFPRRRQQDSQPNDTIENLRLLTDRGVRVLIVHSEGDEGWDYLNMTLGKEVKHLNSWNGVSLKTVPGANHTFTLLSNQEALIQLIETWLCDSFKCGNPTVAIEIADPKT
jgi:dienelactone hydrolase